MYNYWGKINQDNHYHLLVYHSLDVAAVADAYLTEHQELLQAMATGIFGVIPTKTQLFSIKALLIFFIALHDIGKFSVCFQSKNLFVFNSLNPTRKANHKSYHRHDVLGDVIWMTHLFDEFKAIARVKEGINLKKALSVFTGACFGHHGKPIKITDRMEQTTMLRSFEEQDICATKIFFTECKKLFLNDRVIDLSCYDHAEELTKGFNGVSWWLSGLTILADWLGSNDEYFSFQEKSIKLTEYWENIQEPAKRALKESGLNKFIIANNRNYETLLDIVSPRPLQLYTNNVKINENPLLFILEDMTGSGKTEAALMLAYRIMQQGEADGVYFALPTMATANGMYDRLIKSYKNFFDKPEDVSIILAHANSYLTKNFHDSLYSCKSDLNLNGELNSAASYCNAWFADNRKKALLANIGVGTIDQALQSILPNRHQSLRLIGLFRKILIVDEVHACDEYMFELLKTLIEFHTASGGSTILLSATLPQKMRNDLTKTFYKILAKEQDEIVLPDKIAYPLVTYCAINSLPIRTPIEPLPSLCREINIVLCDNEIEIENIILEKLKLGLCVCWIRNTIHDAIEAYQRLEKIYDNNKITLFHARFTMHDRYQLENKIKDLFGKVSTLVQRQGELVIATQVVEQSLDLDFDFMVTDLAPIDLIIQRAGRLQRHPRLEQRPPAKMLIYSPMPTENAQSNWYSALLPNAARVYTNHAQLWLTAKLLSKKPVVKIPEDVPIFVENVYSNDNCLGNVPENLQKCALRVDGKGRGNRESGKMNALLLVQGYQNSLGGSWKEDIYAPTRLSEQVTVQTCLAVWDSERLIPWHNGEKYAWEMSRINVPKYYFSEDNNLVEHLLTNKIPNEFMKKRMQTMLILDKQLQKWFCLEVNEEKDRKLYLRNANEIEYCHLCGLVRKSPQSGE